VTTCSVETSGVRSEGWNRYNLSVGGVPVTLLRGLETSLHIANAAERRQYLSLFERMLSQFKPDIVVNFGGDLLAHEVRSRARARGVTVVFTLHNFNYRTARPFATADAVVVPSHFAAVYYRKLLGLECEVLPNIVDRRRFIVDEKDPRFVTFVNPS